MKIIYTNKGRRIRGVYTGGPYIDLTFGVVDVNNPAPPTEVLNVWDYEVGSPVGPFAKWDVLDSAAQRKVLRAHIAAWVAREDAEMATWGAIGDTPAYDWYQSYLDNL